MENLNYSTVDIDHPDPSSIAAATTAAFQSTEKNRAKNVKQFAWFLLLRVHQTTVFIVRFMSFLWALTKAVNSRLSFSNSSKIGRKRKLVLRFLKTILLLSFATLIFELAAYWNEWAHFQKPNFHGWMHSFYVQWCSIRAIYIAYPIQLFSNFCIILFILQSLDRTILCLGWLWIKLTKMQPRIKTRQEHSTPMVLVQIPMCNEREVYQQSISAVCQLNWPQENLLIQVLDDSSDKKIQMLISDEVSKWSQRGVNIIYHHRRVRTGYKAGNLKSAMNCDYVKDYEFVAIFDADFQPNPDFLEQTVAYFMENPELGLVQTRWSFVNKDENLLTKLQNINLCFHFEVEQQVNSIFLSFFGFNGTAGVWRIKALEDSGGWLERTTVEDMDIAVRAHLNGWKFIFLNDVKVLCEVPESYEAYRKQQHRWHSGPMHLFRLCIPAILKSKISIWKKSNLILLFFLLRKLILPFYSFMLFCVILPLTMFIPEAKLPIWVICYIPLFVSFLNILPAPGSFPFIVPYLLFENTMSVIKFNAMISGLFQFKNSYEWVVTKKAGRLSESDLLTMEKHDSKILVTHSMLHRGASDSELIELNKSTEQLQVMVMEDPESSASIPVKKINKIYKRELSIALLLLTAAARSLLSAQGIHFYFLSFQGISFLVVGLDLNGEKMS